MTSVTNQLGSHHSRGPDEQDRIRTVLFSTLYPSEARPGHGIFVETRLQQLLSSGAVETRVIAPVPWFPNRNGRFGEWGAFAATPKFERRANVNVWHPRYPLLPKVSMSMAPLLLALGARSTVQDLLRQQDFDLFDAHYYYPDGAAVALLSHWFKKPFVVTGRGSDLNLLPTFAIPRAWIRWTARKAARSILVSEALKNRLAELGGDASKMDVVRNGVDLDRFKPIPPEDCRRALGLQEKRWLVSVGNLVSEKRQSIAIETLRYLPHDVSLIIVGDGPDRRRLTALARDTGVAERVMFAGRRSQAELPYWYSVAEVHLLCSEREGWPNVLLESMACGTPVVASAVGGVPEIVKAPIAGRLLPEVAPKVVATTVLDLLETRGSADDVRSYAARFGWQEATSAQVALFRRIAASADLTLAAQAH